MRKQTFAPEPEKALGFILVYLLQLDGDQCDSSFPAPRRGFDMPKGIEIRPPHHQRTRMIWIAHVKQRITRPFL
jgi:hypothetical protein